MKALFRGFCRNENGKETIWFNGEEVKGDWKYGNSLYFENKGKEKHFITGMTVEGCYRAIDEVIPETVSEAVRGLTDKNGRQVFEGDVIKRRGKETLLQIVFNQELSRWELIPLKPSTFSMTVAELVQSEIPFEVIGTKWDKGE